MSAKERKEPGFDAPDPDALTTATVGLVGTIFVVVVIAEVVVTQIRKKIIRFFFKDQTQLFVY